MKHTSKSNPVLVLAAMLGAAGALSAAPAQSGAQAFHTGRALQNPTPPQKVVIPVAPPNVIPISTLPFDINAPGYYQVTQDLTGVAGSNGIRVLARAVFIDLNGFKLNGGINGTLTGIQCTQQSGDTTIFNGTILGWGEFGVSAFFECNVVDVHVLLNKSRGLDLGQSSVVQDCQVVNNEEGGVRGANLMVLDSVVSGNSLIGIEGTEGGLLVRGCSVSFNDVAGINGREPDPTILGRNPCVVEECELIGNGVSGIDLPTFGQVRRCVVTDSTTGLSVDGSSYVAECLVYKNGIGIAASDSIIERCIARDNNAGVSVQSRCVVSDCEVIDNAGDGISGVFRVTVRNCSARGNASGIALQDSGGRIEGCSVTDNQGSGITVLDDAIVANNEVSGNQDRGIRARQSNRIEGNHVTRNGMGIEALGGRNLIVRNSLDSNGVQMQIAADNVQGPFLKTKGFLDNTNPWANFDLSFPSTFP